MLHIFEGLKSYVSRNEPAKPDVEGFVAGLHYKVKRTSDPEKARKFILISSSRLIFVLESNDICFEKKKIEKLWIDILKRMHTWQF